MEMQSGESCKQPILSKYADDEVVMKTMPFYVDELTLRVEAMKVAIAEEQWNELQKVTHKITGSSASFGFTDLAEISDRINSLAKANPSGESCSKLFEEFMDVYERTKLGFRARMQ